MKEADPYAVLRAKKTQARSPRWSTEEIITRLEQWRGRCDFRIEGARRNSIVLRFEQLPEDLDTFAAELEEFCPDAVFAFSSYANLAREVQGTALKLPEQVRQMVEGLDIHSEDFNREALKRSLRHGNALVLFWGLP